MLSLMQTSASIPVITALEAAARLRDNDIAYLFMRTKELAICKGGA